MYHDQVMVGTLAVDEGMTPLTVDQITDEVNPNPTIAQALLTASGQVESWCLRGERYAPTDLAALTGASQAMLIELVADLAFYRLGKRRWKDPVKECPGYKEAMETLKALGEGTAIFSFQESAEAGNMQSFDLKYNSQGQRQRITDKARPFFGRRMNNGPTFIDLD
jgi:phage gp36-like protein